MKSGGIMLKLKLIIAWFFFLSAIALLFIPYFDDSTRLIKHYGKYTSPETIEKFYSRGYSDHLIQSIPAIFLILFAMLLLSFSPKSKKE